MAGTVKGLAPPKSNGASRVRARHIKSPNAVFSIERQGEILLAFDPEISVEPRLERRSIPLEAGGGVHLPEQGIDPADPISAISIDRLLWPYVENLGINPVTLPPSSVQKCRK